VFTGLIDDVGTIEDVASADVGRVLRVRCRYDDLVPGESIAVNGACLTVRECGPRWFTAAAIDATIQRTTIGTWKKGRRVNLERALRADARLGGHIVQGHVDGVATVVDPLAGGHPDARTRRRAEAYDGARYLKLVLPDEVVEITVPHGSITVDGVSLTVSSGPIESWIEVALIDFTLRHTTLGDLIDGDTVHVEGDVIGKHVRQLVQPHLQART
jgi:riboflavin synthase